MHIKSICDIISSIADKHTLTILVLSATDEPLHVSPGIIKGIIGSAKIPMEANGVELFTWSIVLFISFLAL